MTRRLLFSVAATTLLPWGATGALPDTVSKLWKDARSLIECQVCKTSKLSGTVDDCCIDFSTVDDATQDVFLPVLTELQNSTFFKYFKVNLEKDCPFWEEDGQCHLRDCSVCECSPDEIPKLWLEEDEKAAREEAIAVGDVMPGDNCSEQLRKEKDCQDKSQVEKRLGRVDHSQSSPVEDLFKPWSEADGAVWTEQEEGEESFQYVNLQLNPEKFTGYSGASASRVWKSIYMENCFAGLQENTCKEKRVFYRLLSGLQSSITTQIANDYRFEDGTWGKNLKLFTWAVGMHPDRLTNLYFAYVFVLRAIGKARPWLLSYDYSTGNSKDDQRTRDLISKLLSSEVDESGRVEGVPISGNAIPVCLKGFDESGMFEQADGGGVGGELKAFASQPLEMVERKEEFMAKFHNISRIMDCVGCEKCKLWGKLETLGLGTAIKIMMVSPDEEGDTALSELHRNELIALVNTAAQLAKSVGSVPAWKWLEVQEHVKKAAPGYAQGLVVVLLMVAAAVFMPGCFRRRSSNLGPSASTAGKARAPAEAVKDRVSGLMGGDGGIVRLQDKKMD